MNWMRLPLFWASLIKNTSKSVLAAERLALIVAPAGQLLVTDILMLGFMCRHHFNYQNIVKNMVVNKKKIQFIKTRFFSSL